MSVLSTFSFWTNRQIRHFLETQAHQVCWSRPLTPFETLCQHKTQQRHLISLIYSFLSEDPDQTPAPSQTSWNNEIQAHLTNEDWTTIHEYAHKSSLNVAIQENGYKIVTRWYRTHSRLHKFLADIPDTCWRCEWEVGTMLHVWWTCEKLQPFWKQVHDLISHVTTFSLDYTPAQFLLHHTSLSRKTYYKSLAMHMVNAARLCIPKHWRSTSIPTITEWFSRISMIRDMEELIHISQDRMHKFSIIWACWSHFTTTDRYRQYTQ